MKTRIPSRSSLVASVAAALLLGAMWPADAQALQMRGFRGLMWGDPPAYLGEAELVGRDGDVQCYRRERENLLFGDSALRSVRYCFHQGKLFMVSIDSLVDPYTLGAEFERGYGPPDTRNGGTARWGKAADAVSAELVASAPGTPATLRLRAREYAPVR